MKRILFAVSLIVLAGCSMFSDVKSGRIAFYSLSDELSTGYDFDIMRELDHTKKGNEIYCYPFYDSNLPKPGILCDEYDPEYSYIIDLGFITMDSAMTINDSLIEAGNYVKEWHIWAYDGKSYLLSTGSDEQYILYIDSIFENADSLLCDHVIYFSFRKK